MTNPLKSVLLTACLVLSGSGAVQAQTFYDATASARADLEKAVAELNTVNEKIAAEKLPLAQRLAQLEESVRVKRSQAERAQRLRDNQNVDLEALRTTVKARTAENDYLASLLTDYARAFESRVHVGEVQRHRTLIATANNAADNVNLSQAEKFAEQIKVIQAALDRVGEVMGGLAFEGQALAPSGNLERGRFALFGPIAVFASAGTDAAGLADVQLGTAEPALVPLDEALTPGLRTLANSGTGILPVDATMGNALKIASTRETWLEHLRKGGPVMIPLLALAVFAAVIGLFKWIELSRVQPARGSDLSRILDRLAKGEKDGAMAVAQAIRGPAGELLAVAVEHSQESKELIEEALYERLLRSKPRLMRFMPFIALAAATAPLLGLLGTVTGMINTFKMITVFGTGDPKLLSSGISEALITTEYGLIIAVPCLLVHALLNRKARGVIDSMEQTVTGFINGLPNPQ